MVPPDQVAQLSSALVARAGGYLRNPVRRDGVTCSVCTTPCPGFSMCLPCKRQAGLGVPLADAVAPLTYAVARVQSGYVMRGYKADPPVAEHQAVVLLLCVIACSVHVPCAGKVVGAPVTHWTTVPSLPARPGEHPLHRLVNGLLPASEVSLTAAAQAANPREVRPDHFSVPVRLSPDSHVMIMDDTWASGGHAQSAALSLRAAGAGHVSILVVARWVKPDYEDNARFLRDLPDYDPGICPWTGSHCP